MCSAAILKYPVWQASSCLPVFPDTWHHHCSTLSIHTCSFMPLLKSARKDPTKFDSWRAVAGASQLLKLFEYVLVNFWGGHLESNILQFGFKKKTGTDQYTWRLLLVAEHYLTRGTPTLCWLLDVRKGFPGCSSASYLEYVWSKETASHSLLSVSIHVPGANRIHQTTRPWLLPVQTEQRNEGGRCRFTYSLALIFKYLSQIE